MRRNSSVVAILLMIASCSHIHTFVPSSIAPLGVVDDGTGRPSTFLAMRFPPGPPGIVLASSTDGHVIRFLFPDRNYTSDLVGADFVGDALGPEGDLWVTYSRGPDCTRNSTICDPKPHTCGGKIWRFDARTGKRATVLSANRDAGFGRALPSPDGRLLAYSQGGCVNGLRAQILVRELATGRSRSIGTGLPACSGLILRSWTRDSRSLLVNYEVLTETRPAGLLASCGRTKPGVLVRVDALRDDSGVRGPTARPRSRCAFSDAAAMVEAIVVVEGCGENYEDSFALVRLDDALHEVGRIPLDRCLQSGIDVAADHAGTSLLVSGSTLCDPQGRGEFIPQLWLLTSRVPTLTLVRKGDIGFSDIVW